MPVTGIKSAAVERGEKRRHIGKKLTKTKNAKPTNKVRKRKIKKN